MILKNKNIKKFLSCLLIVLILTPTIFFYNAKEAHAELPVADWKTRISSFFTAGSTAISASNSAKEWALKILQETLRTFARRLLQQMTEATVTWINTGFHGAPLFLERPGSFFKDIAKSEIKNLVNIIGYDSNRNPFGKSTAINIIESYKRQFAINSQYTLSRVVNDPQLLRRYRNDFSVGGWNGFLINTQYPQNNYIGYQLMVADELSRRLAGTGQSEAEIVRDTLQQGLGFLSPQKCETNPAYNIPKNQFQQPKFKCPIEYNEPACNTGSAQEQNKCLSDYYNQWSTQCNQKYTEWSKTNVCPDRANGTSGFINTTPGSVVGSSIMKAITGPYDQTSLAAAMGNSLSAIFDALLNKFMSSGLNALSKKVNGTGGNNDNDDFDYYGHTLGSPANTNTTNGGLNWDGPDQEIILSNFKKEVQNAIDATNKEIRFINNNDASNPGFLQVFEKIVPKTQELDICLPGPNIGWEDRVDAEAQNSIAEANYTNIAAAANLFKTWLKNAMRNELPSSVNYISAVNSIKGNSEKRDELTKRVDALVDTLVKLNSIKESLSGITTQPTPGSASEDNMVRLKQRFDGMRIEISSTTTVSQTQNSLYDAKDTLTNLDKLITKCTDERTNKGWANPGGENSLRDNTHTEKYVFCTAFGNPLINCNTVFRTNGSDYTSSGANNPNNVGGGTPQSVIPETPVEKLGVCIKGLNIKRDITESACNSTLPGGIWVENS